MPIRNTLIVSMTILMHACSVASSPLSSSMEHKSNNQPAKDAPQTASTQDSETTKSTAPVQVAGAFLTSACDIASASDGFPSVADQDAYGCAVHSTDGSKYSGTVQFSSVVVNFTDSTAPVDAGINPTPGASRWHTYFYLPVSDHGKIKGYDLAGSVDNQNTFSMSASSSPAQEAAPVIVASTGTPSPAPAPAPAPTPAACTPRTDFKMDPAFPYYMDSVTAKSRASTAYNAGGAPIPVVVPGGFKPNDSLIMTAATGVSAVAVGGLTDLTNRSACPQNWKLHFLDNNANILNTNDADLSSWLNHTKIIPVGSATATIGYTEPGSDSYKDNEGAPNVAKPTGGCHYTFTLTRACQ